MATLTISFTPSSNPPANGYIVKYKPVGGTTYTTVTPNPSSSPVIIPNVVSTQYEGTIQSSCSLNSSTVVSFLSPSPGIPFNVKNMLSGPSSYGTDYVLTWQLINSATATIIAQGTLHYGEGFNIDILLAGQNRLIRFLLQQYPSQTGLRGTIKRLPSGSFEGNYIINAQPVYISGFDINFNRYNTWKSDGVNSIELQIVNN